MQRIRNVRPGPRVSRALNTRVSTPHRTTTTLSSPPHSAAMIRRLYSETVATKAASATFSRSMTRFTCRSDPCAVKLYGIPVSRRTMNPASAGWFAK
jgi:hypothetical protein